MRRSAICVVLAAMSVGCANNDYGKRYNDPAYNQWKTSAPSGRTHRALVDTGAHGFDAASYEADNRDCNRLAAQLSVGSSTADGALGGLLAGAVFGTIIGSAYGDTGHGAAYGAALGTASGAMHGAAGGVQRHSDIVRSCMSGRGYRVLD